VAYFSSCLNADEFHTTEDEKKKDHPPVRVITHVIPLAGKSDAILGQILLLETRPGKRARNFHKTYEVGGWDDHIIQPARGAILDYYKVCTPNISSITCLR